MRGINYIVFAGNVGGNVIYDTTGQGNECCSFQIASEDKNGFVTWCRVNAYSGLVNICHKRVSKGSYVIVTGNVMNREKSGNNQKLTEIKAVQIIVPTNEGSFDIEEDQE